MAEMGYPPPSPPPAPAVPPPAPTESWRTSDLFLGLLMVVGGLMLSGGIVLSVIDREPDTTLIALGFQDLIFVGVPLLIASWRVVGSPWSLVGFNRFKLSDLSLVAGAFGAQVVVTIIVTALLLTPEQDTIVEDMNFDRTTLAAVSAFVAIVILAPVAEETLFRGLFFGALRVSLPFWAAAVISGVMFGAVHLTTGNLAVAALLAFFGVLLAYLYERTGSLGPPIILHGVNNLIAILPLIN